MEPKAVQNKQKFLNKGKLKKTIKNVICRPDPMFWPVISEDHGKDLEFILAEYKVHIPVFKKLNWKVLKLMPKEERPKAPYIEKVDGLIFGISECTTAILSNECSAIIIDSGVNPRSIAIPVVESCVKNNIPVVCLKDLRIISACYFGIRTSFLCIKEGHLLNVRDKISEIAKIYQPQKQPAPKHEADIEMSDDSCDGGDNAMDIDTSQYLLRPTKNSRAFVPPSDDKDMSYDENKFIGQNFIKFSDTQNRNREVYMKMMVKRMSNNPNRVPVINTKTE